MQMSEELKLDELYKELGILEYEMDLLKPASIGYIDYTYYLDSKSQMAIKKREILNKIKEIKDANR